ncbi:hypothetical protein J1D01_08775 [Seonamhaeicola sp. NFXS20]|uniref:hypothetical protein n=1 Tax=Seonamhaeicola sp. NFXS20 TaxID=2816959 RepID=UPI003B8B2CCD
MKIQYHIALLVLIISCGQGPKTDKEPEIETQGAVEIIETALDTLPKSVHLDFGEVIANSQTKKLPHIEDTNFDSFIDEDDYDEVDAEALKLNQIYPDFNSEGHNYRAITIYKIPVNTNFHTIVTTIQHGDNEMETIIINYDTEGNIIDHKQVAFDEIAEGMSRSVSRISESKLTVNKIFWGNTKEVEEIEYEIRGNGTIEKVSVKKLNDSFKNFALINGVLTDLNLDWVQTKTDLISTLEHPDNPNESIVVIPEVVDEGEQYFDLNSHIVIADNRSGKIMNKYFESQQSNQWVSDAVELREIIIDTALYPITEEIKAFGIHVNYYGMSRVNPYSNKTLAIFVKSGDSLKKVLHNYSVMNYGGEWDGDCNGEFVHEGKTLVTGTKKSNGYYDILVNNKITKTKNFTDKNGECQSNETVERKEMTLKFNGSTYAEHDSEAILFSEYHPEKLEGIHIDRFDVDHAYQLEAFKIAAGNYKPEDGRTVAPDTETDWGDRLLMLDASNKTVYQSKGVGDLYLFEPHFYKSSASDKVIIICQMAFEYPFGGEAFILENGTLKQIGTLDMEGGDEEKYLTEIVEINEIDDTIIFALKSDEVILKPGSEDTLKTNKNVIYVYQNNELALKTN